MKAIFNLQLLTNAVLTVKIIMTCIIGDDLVNRFQHNQLTKALIDNFTHQLVGLLSALVISLNLRSNVSHMTVTEVILLALFGLASAGIIDIDHFVEARSLQLVDATRLTHRPFLHNSTITVLLLVVALFVSKSNTRVAIWLLVLFCSLATHHVRDGTRRGLWFHGFGHTDPLPYWGYVAIEALLPHVVVVLMRLSVNRHEGKVYHMLEMSPVLEV